MKNFLLIIIGVLLPLMSACSTGESFFNPTTPSSTSQVNGSAITEAQLNVDIAAFDFGVQSLYSYNNKTITITNTGIESATDFSVDPLSTPFSFNTATAKPCSGAIGSDACTIVITYHPVSETDSLDQIVISYKSSGVVRKITVDVHGQGTNVASVKLSDGSLIDFGSLAQGSSVVRVYDVVYTGKYSATGVTFSVAPPFSIVAAQSTCGNVVTANCKLAIKFDATTVGSYSIPLKWGYNNGAYAAQNQVNLTGNVTANAVPAVLSINSGSLYDFGVQEIGKTIQKTLNVSYSGTLPANNVSFGSLSTANFAVVSGGTCGSQINAACTVIVSFSPVSAGVVYNDSLKVNYSNGSSNTSASVALKGTGGNAASLTISPTTEPVDFGSFSLRQATTKTFTLQNAATSAAASNIALAGLSGAFSYSSNSCGTNLASGASCTFVVRFGPTAVGVINQTVQVNYNNGQATRAIRGTGVSLGIITANAVNFGSLVVGDSKAVAVAITYYGSDPVVIDSISSLSAPFSIPGGFPGQSGTTIGNCGQSSITATCNIVLAFSPTSIGTFSVTLTLTYHSGSSSAQTVAIALSGKGVAAPSVLAFQESPSVDFGSVVVSSSGERVLTLLKSGAAAAVSVSGSISNSLFKFKGGSFPGTGGTCSATVSSNCTIVVTFAPTASGAQSGVFTLSYNDGLANRTATINLTGAGVSGANLVLTSAMAGKVAVGSASSFTLSVSNSGNLTATGISASALAAPFNIVSTTCAASLAGAGSCAYTVSFQPTKPGLQSTSFSMAYSNGVSSNSVNASLSINGTGTIPVTQISVNGDHSCTIDDVGQIKCWGHNNAGQLGLGNTVAVGVSANQVRPAMATVNLGTGRYAKAVSAGYWHTCAILDNDSVKCWGWNGNGQLGIPASTTSQANIGDEAGEMGDSLAAVNLGSGLTAKSISSGYAHTCAILSNDQIKCWGLNSQGQLGLGDTTDRGVMAADMGNNLPFIELGSGLTAKQVSANSGHTCAVLSDNSVKCWGDNFYGQLGQGDTISRGINSGEMGNALKAINLGTGRSAKSVQAGGGFTCALLDSNEVKCWGYNRNGNLGKTYCQNQSGVAGPCANASYPFTLYGYGAAANQMGDDLVSVALGTGRTAKAISVSNFSVCAILDNSSIKCWGDNSYGQLGLGNTVNRGITDADMGDNLPAVSLGVSGAPLALSAGNYHACLLTASKELKCWGDNRYGDLGLGDTNNRGDIAGEMGASLPLVPAY